MHLASRSLIVISHLPYTTRGQKQPKQPQLSPLYLVAMDYVYIIDRAGFLVAQIEIFDYWVLLVAMEIGMGRDFHNLATQLLAQPVVSSGRMLMTNGPMSWWAVQLLQTSFLPS